jgi:hypothetical protein
LLFLSIFYLFYFPLIIYVLYELGLGGGGGVRQSPHSFHSDEYSKEKGIAGSNSVWCDDWLVTICEKFYG